MTPTVRYIAAMVVAWAVTADAGEMSVQVSARETYVGQPVHVEIIVTNAKQHDPPEVPDIEGATVQMARGASENSRVTIINGQMTREVSVSYLIEVTPTRAGTIRVPPIAVRVDGEVRKTDGFDIVAVKSETGDLLFVGLKGDRESLYVGESLDLTLQIWVKPYVDRRFRVKLGERDMWRQVDLEASQWDVFRSALEDMARRRQRPRGIEVLREDSQGNRREYYLYELETTMWPQRPGMLAGGDIRIVVSYPTKLERDRSFFSMGELALAGTRPVVAGATVDPIEVRPVPTEGRPPFFRDAVGRYEIDVTAKPTDVRVGDPITLTLTVRGDGRLDVLQAPPLAQIPELTAGFQVPDEPLAGTVEQGAKRFTQSIRAKADTVTQIPPIPFAYFDPQAETFVVAHSDPIPIRVEPAQAMPVSQVVEGQPGPVVATHLTELRGGIMANYYDMDEVLTDQAFASGTASAAVATLPPVLFVACWIARRRSERLRDQSYARRRFARRTALRSLGHAASGQATEAADRVAIALLGYVADRCDLPTAGLTRAEATEALIRRNVGSEVVERTDALLRRCDDHRYAGANEATAGDLVVQARQCVGELEKQRF